MFIVPEMAIFEKAMKVSAMNSAFIANNVANVNTKGYKRQEISFSDVMKKVLKGREELEQTRQIAQSQPSLMEINGKGKYLERLQFLSNQDLGLKYAKDDSEFAYTWHKLDTVEDIKNRAINKTIDDVVKEVKPMIIKDMSSQKEDGNNVNPDIELRRMAINTGKYNTTALVVSAEFRTLKQIVTAR